MRERGDVRNHPHQRRRRRRLHRRRLHRLQIYPQEDPDLVFQKLLMENVLPLAARRRPIAIDDAIYQKMIETKQTYRMHKHRVRF